MPPPDVGILEIFCLYFYKINMSHLIIPLLIFLSPLTQIFHLEMLYKRETKHFHRKKNFI